MILIKQTAQKTFSCIVIWYILIKRNNNSFFVEIEVCGKIVKLSIIGENTKEQITHWCKKRNTHQGPPGEDGHDVNHEDGDVPHTNNGAQGDTDRQA